MFSKVFAIAAVIFTITAQVHAHTAISPVLGVAGAPKRADAQRPSTATPCGKTNIAANIDTSTPVVAAADGTFTVTATNFNGGRDGSRQVAMTVDATGTGKNFVAGTVSKNGVAAPAAVGSDQIVASLPAGTKCTGGKNKNLCIASFKTLGNFGNCVVVQQGAGAATNNAATDTATPATNGTAAAGNTTTTAADKGQTRKERIQAAIAKAKAAGTRAPRALLADLESREEGTLEVVKRNILSWMWA